MNVDLATKLISEAKEIYNGSSPNAYSNFINWAKSFNGDEKGKIVKEIYHFVDLKNKNTKTLIWEIDKYYEQEILKYLIDNLLRQV